MPRTINEGFLEFLRKLTPSDYESDAAIKHRASIKQCIESNFTLQRFWRTGSFGNGTSISGYSDVDYVASISRDDLSSDSAKSLSSLRSALDRRFPSTGVRTSCPAVVVPFGVDAKETTEITPADYLREKNGFSVYDIPDCSGSWMNASPDAHNAYVRSIDNNLSSKLKPLIRFMKAWKYHQNVPISSFYLELRVAKYSSEETCIVYSIDVERVLSHLSGVGLARIQDPVGVSGYISPCKSSADLSDAQSKLATALARARKARAAEKSENIAEAFEWWDKLFGCRFPSYY